MPTQTMGSAVSPPSWTQMETATTNSPTATTPTPRSTPGPQTFQETGWTRIVMVSMGWRLQKRESPSVEAGLV